jgi:hypothetical protein
LGKSKNLNNNYHDYVTRHYAIFGG